MNEVNIQLVESTEFLVLINVIQYVATIRCVLFMKTSCGKW